MLRTAPLLRRIAIRNCSTGPSYSMPDEGFCLPFSAAVRVGGHIYVSGQVNIMAGDDTALQAEATMKQVEQALAIFKSRRERIVSCEAVLKDPQDLPILRDLYSEWLGTTAPPLQVHIAEELCMNARVEIAAFALTHGNSSLKGPDAGDNSVTITATADTTVGEDTLTQLATVFAKADSMLASLGYSKTEIVESRGRIQNMSELMVVNKAYEHWIMEAEDAILPAMMVHQPSSPLPGKFELSMRVVPISFPREGMRANDFIEKLAADGTKYHDVKGY